MIDDVAYDLENADIDDIFIIAEKLLHVSKGDTTYIQINISHVRASKCFKLEYYKNMFNLK